MTRRIRTARESGFTLVEVLVALLVMAIMAGMAWQGVDGIVRARDASRLRMEQSLRLSAVIAQWEQDLASVQDTLVAPPTQVFGWSKDGNAVLISDGFDVWKVPTNGGTATNLTVDGKSKGIKYQRLYSFETPGAAGGGGRGGGDRRRRAGAPDGCAGRARAAPPRAAGCRTPPGRPR